MSPQENKALPNFKRNIMQPSQSTSKIKSTSQYIKNKDGNVCVTHEYTPSGVGGHPFKVIDNAIRESSKLLEQHRFRECSSIDLILMTLKLSCNGR